MRKTFAGILIAALAFGLAVCGGSSYPAMADSGESTAASAGEMDQFIFRTVDEMLDFMKSYGSSGEVIWDDPNLSLKGDGVTLSGKLAPDKEHFKIIYLNLKKNMEEKLPEILADFCGDFYEKTGISFPGAENLLSDTDGESPRAESDDGKLSLTVKTRNRRIAIRTSEDEMPYSIEDAAAYMEGFNGQEASITRAVYEPDPSDPSLWTVRLDENDEFITSVNVGCECDDPDECKAFFGEFAAFFLRGEALDAANELINEYYDTPEESETEHISNGTDYRLRIYNNYVSELKKNL